MKRIAFILAVGFVAWGVWAWMVLSRLDMDAVGDNFLLWIVVGGARVLFFLVGFVGLVVGLGALVRLAWRRQNASGSDTDDAVEARRFGRR